MKLNINIFKGKRNPEGYVEKYLRPGSLRDASERRCTSAARTMRRSDG